MDAVGVEVHEGYGLTETSPTVTANRPGARRIGSVGRPIRGVRVEVDTRVTGDPRVGEIVVHGPGVMRGYHGLPEETARVIAEDGGLRTGDLGYVDDDGYVFITGRIKEQYKLENGRYVAPVPVEEALKLSPYIAGAMLHGANRPYNVVLVSLNVPAIRQWAEAEGLSIHDPAQDDRVAELLHREIEARVQAFKPFERPQKFFLVTEELTPENGMLTPTLKVKRRRVLERWGAEIDRLY